MTVKHRVAAASTHYPVGEKAPALDSDAKVKSVDNIGRLYDPEHFEPGSTHSEEEPKVKVTKAAVAAGVKAALTAPEDAEDGDIPPGALEADADEDMPVEDGAGDGSTSTLPSTFGVDGDDEDLDDDDEDDEDGDGIEADADEDGDAVNEDELETDLEAFNVEDLEDAPEDEIESAADDEDAVEPEAFEAAADEEDVCMVDADAMPDEVDEDDLVFASLDQTLHVIAGNRIIASMGRFSARKSQREDVYLKPQFQDVVVATISEKGLRKGLVQSGFVLSKVKVSAKSKIVHTLVKQKVEARVQQHVTAAAAREQALEQSFAIAAVGINRNFFKEVKNTLAANLTEELKLAGVANAGRIIRSAFAQDGVSYAKAILTLANKISTMPEQVRAHYVTALDMTDDADFVPEDAEDGDVEAEAENEGMEDFGTSDVVASLNNPVRKNVGALLVGSTARAILTGNQSLV